MVWSLGRGTEMASYPKRTSVLNTQLKPLHLQRFAASEALEVFVHHPLHGGKCLVARAVTGVECGAGVFLF